MRIERLYSWLVRVGRYLDSCKQLPEEGIADVVFPGGDPSYKLVVPLSPGAGREAYLYHVREPFSSATYACSLNLLGSDTTVYELGANVGYFLIPGAMYSKQVYAYEPQQRLHKYLKKNIEINHLQNVQLSPVAIWKESGKVRMRFADKHNLAQIDSSGDFEVDAISPKDLPMPSTNQSVVRMDIEGGETKILREVVSHINPDYMFIELHPNIVGVSATVSLVNDFISNGYLPLTFFEPLPETIGVPFDKVSWKFAEVGPSFRSCDKEDLLRGMYGAFSRGWIVHTHWYRDFKLLQEVYREAPWSRVYGWKSM